MKTGRFKGLQRSATRWSVGGHIIAIVVIAMLVFAAVMGVVGIKDFRHARASAITDAAFQVSLGSDAVAEAVTQGAQLVASLVTQPTMADQVAAIVANPAVCPLEIANIGIFARSALHFTAPEGKIACSSAAKDAYKQNVTVAASTFFGKLPKASAPVETGLFTDPITKTTSFGYAIFVRDGAGKPVGAIVFGMAMNSANAGITKSYAGPRGVAFTLVDRPTQTILFSTEAPQLAGKQLPSSISDGAWAAGLDNAERIYRSQRIPGTSWQIYGSLTERVALHDARARLGQQAAGGAAVLLVTLLLGLVLNRMIAGPLRRLRAAVDQAARDVRPAPVEVEGPAEVGALLQAFNDMVEARVASDGRLEHHLMHDAATGLPNRLVFTDRVTLALSRAKRSHATAAVLFVGLDRMTQLQRGLGPEQSDLVLAALANRIPHVLRPGDTVARYSSDILAVLCEEIVSAEQAAVVAQRIRDAVGMPIELVDGDMILAASVGVSLSGGDDTAEGMLAKAEQAMTLARATEKGVAFATQGGTHDASWRIKAEARLRRAIDQGSIAVHYQPVVDLTDGSPLGFEALARWQDPELGSVPPTDFIPIAEDSGLIRSLGQYVLAEACAQGARWRTAGHPLEIAVNVSTKQLLDPEFPEQVRAALTAAGLPPYALRLEITESFLIGDSEAEDALRRLKEIGVKLSIDDFGTGFSSLSYLRKFPIDQLKIDRAFIADLEETSATYALVKAIVDMAKALGVTVVAEGVETAAQETMLRALGCESAQGYLIARPGEAEKADAFLARRSLATAGRTVSLN